MPSCLDAALAYAKRGWPVLALSPNSKIPLKDDALQPHGSLSASTDEAHIRELWRLYPNAGVAIATGKQAGITVVDFDGPDASAAVKAAGLHVPLTYTVKTRKGYHVYIAYDPDLKQGTAILPHLDIRNDGGSAVAPPTTIDGITYTVFRDKPVLEWPELTTVAVAALAAKRTAGRTATADHPGWVSELLAKGAPEGQRNASAVRVAGYFRSLNMPQDIAVTALEQFAQACQPPMDSRELAAVVASVWRYQPAQGDFAGKLAAPPLVDATLANRRLFQWPQEGVQIRAERIREHSDGSVTCWLSISVHNLGELYGPVSFNLLSDRSRSSLTKALAERYHEANWAAMLDLIGKQVVNGLTQQGVSEDAADIVPERGRAWLAHPLLKAGQPMLLYGDGGTGKSTLAMTLAFSLALGVPYLPGVKVEKSIPSMYLDWEGTRDEFGAVREAFESANSAKVPRDMLRYRRLRQPLPAELDAIQREVGEWGIQAVFVDSIVGAAGAEVVEAEGARLHFGCLAQLGVASVNMTHVTHEGRKDGHKAKPYGSVFYWNYARSVWQLRRDKESQAIGLFHEKANYSQLFKPLSWQARIENYPDDSIKSLRYERADIQASPALAAGTYLIDRIEALMRDVTLWEPVTLAEELGEDVQTVRTTLRRWRGKRVVQVPPTMQWGRLQNQPRDSVA